MKGKYRIIVQNNRVRYELEIKRNLTIIRGDSASGKTTLIHMLESASLLGDSSGVEVICEKKCRTLNSSDWKIILSGIHDQIVFLDEENQFMKSQEFAATVKNSDNYYVLITREDLPNLPYSVDEIYGIHTSGKYHDLKRTYNELYQIYSAEEFIGKERPDKVIVEDSNSGYDFYSCVCSDVGIDCESAGGKSNLRRIAESAGEGNILAVADGAAIGSEMNELYQLMKYNPKIKCFLPESFEWLILRTGLIGGKKVQEILEHPEDYIESVKFFSWERFFTALLMEYSKNTYLKYNKSHLNETYLHEKNKKAILNVMQGIDFRN